MLGCVNFKGPARAASSLALSLCLVAAAVVPAQAAASGRWEDDLGAGEQARATGDIADSIRRLQAAVRDAPSAVRRLTAMTSLAQSLAQSGRFSEADSLLQAAYGQADDASRAAISLLMGNVALQAHDPQRARRYYDMVLAGTTPGPGPDQTRLSAALNRIRLAPELERLAALTDLQSRIRAAGDRDFRARAMFTAGQLASESLAAAQVARPEDFAKLLSHAYQNLVDARDLAEAVGDAPLVVDAGDALAGLYESQGRLHEAAVLNRRAIAAATHLAPGQAGLPLTRLQWRAARLHQRAGEPEAALGSYLIAAHHLEAIRQDLPIEDTGGRSTYETLQRPIFLGLLDVLLGDIDRLPPQARQGRLATALNAIELAHQAELQDYLGDRCAVDNVRAEGNAAPAPDVAVIYPVILKNRLEVLVRTNRGDLHHAIPLATSELAETILDFRGELIDSTSNDFLAHAQLLYDWLLRPFAAALDDAQVRQLVIVPDGVLRLIPFAVLNDGRLFLAERYWLSTVTGLTMTERGVRARRLPASLLAGLSTPGPVVERLLGMGFTAGGPESVASSNRTLRRSLAAAAVAHPGGDASVVARTATLRSQLELPGARSEIRGLEADTHGRSLLDAQFTVEQFTRAVHSGDYAVVHVASHGFFGASVAESFLLAYDDVIRIDELQRLVAVNDAQQPGLDLLTLSACDTATGDDRAPLGFAGAGIKARARSVVGSLWAVSDDATQHFMDRFYAGLAQYGKAEAFTRAQRSLMQSPQFAHPYFWAPFILTGEWD